MKFQLIALDVDGTLLNDEHELTEDTRIAVRDAKEAGAVIVLCTGRGPVSALPVFEQLGLTGLMIPHNGATVLEYASRKVLYDYRFEFRDIKPAVDYCRENGIHYDLCTPFDLYVDRLSEKEKAMYALFALEPSVIPDVRNVDDPKVKFTLFGTEEQMDQTERDWDAIGCSLRKIRSGVHFIDVMNPLASKGNALKQLCSDWGIDRERVMAIGNYYNDLEMIEWAGLGIAMSNSPEEVRRRADAVTVSNNEHGVARAIRKYC